MALNVKKTGRLLFWLCSAAYLVIFLLFYVPNYVFEEIDYELSGVGLDVYLITRSALEQLVNMLCPLCCGAFLFLCAGKTGRALLGCLTFTAPALVYSLPYCYLYALSFGYDSVRAALISLGLSLLGGAVVWLHITAIYFICRWVGRRNADKILRESEPGLYRLAKNPNRESNVRARRDELLRVEATESKIFDFDSPVIWGILIASIAEFAVRVVVELVNTVTFMVSVNGLFVESEIITIVLTYLFMLLELALGYSACYGLKMHLTKKEKNEPLAEGEENA